MTPSQQYLSKQESSHYVASIPKPRDRTIVMTLLHTGLFLSEMALLTYKDILWDQKHLNITGSRKRQVPISDALLDQLKIWTDIFGSMGPDTHLFVTQKGKLTQLSDRAIEKLIRHHAQTAGLSKPVTARMLRNTYAKQLISTGISDQKVKKNLGLSDETNIMRYKNLAKTPHTPAPENTPKDDMIDDEDSAPCIASTPLLSLSLAKKNRLSDTSLGILLFLGFCAVIISIFKMLVSSNDAPRTA